VDGARGGRWGQINEARYGILQCVNPRFVIQIASCDVASTGTRVLGDVANVVYIRPWNMGGIRARRMTFARGTINSTAAAAAAEGAVGA
jgi:hypothetical protein